MPHRATPSRAEQRSPTSVFIADDDDQLRSLLRLLLEAEPDLTVVGDAGSGPCALEALEEREAPDVLLVDVNMPATDPREVLRVARDLHPTLQIVVYSGEDEASARQRIGDAVSYGYVVKGVPDDLLAALRATTAARRSAAAATAAHRAARRPHHD